MESIKDIIEILEIYFHASEIIAKEYLKYFE